MSKFLGPEFTHQDYEIISEDEIYTGYCALRAVKLRFRLFQGGWSQTIVRELVTKTPAVAVLLYDPTQDKIVMIEQFRTGALQDTESPWLLEIVAGLIDGNDTPESTAYREAKEETNCEIYSLKHICTYKVSPGISNEITHVYCGLIKAPEKPGIHGLGEEGENIKVHVINAEDAFLLLKQGKINSASAVIALQWFEVNHSSLRDSQ